MNVKLKIEGQVQGIVESTHEGKITKKLQFLNKTDKGLKLINVKMLETQSLTDIKEGSFVSIECKVSTMKDSFEVFYSQNGELKTRK